MLTGSCESAELSGITEVKKRIAITIALALI
jgi:hypothetical protein